MILVRAPSNVMQEAIWLCDFIFKRINVHYEIVINEDSDSWIIENDSGNQIIEFPNIFFQNWETIYNDPQRISDQIDTSVNVSLTFLSFTDHKIPVIIGDNSFTRQEGLIRFNFDIFSTIFLFLSRVEEYIVRPGDIHGRIKVDDLIAHKLNVLDKPIVDIYVEFIRSILFDIFKIDASYTSKYTVILSHDVDRPLRYININILPNLRLLAGDLFKNLSLKCFCYGIIRILGFSKYSNFKDPYDSFDWIIDNSISRNLKSNFFIICDSLHKKFDPKYSINDDFMVSLISKIRFANFPIYLHPSYESHNNFEQFKREHSLLCVATNKINIQESRMHYLRFTFPFTLRIICDCNIAVDNTMGFVNTIGFRSGTSSEYFSFDVFRRHSLPLKIRPLIAMDAAIIRHFKRFGMLSTISEVKYYVNECRKYNGNFSLLWHNSELWNNRLRRLYTQVLDNI